MYVNFVVKRPSLLCVDVDIATRCSRLALTFVDCAPTHRSQQGGTDGELWGDGGIQGVVWGVTEADVDVWVIGYDCNRNQYMYTCMLISWMLSNWYQHSVSCEKFVSLQYYVINLYASTPSEITTVWQQHFRIIQLYPWLRWIVKALSYCRKYINTNEIILKAIIALLQSLQLCRKL